MADNDALKQEPRKQEPKSKQSMSLSSVARRMVASKAGGAGKISPVTARVWVNKDTKVICQGITGK
jgi:hypothetical protein